jgi:hypothetical protein
VVLLTSQPRPGDIAAFHDAKLKGKKGLQSYTQQVGSVEDPLVGVVIESEAKKHKLRVLQVERGVSAMRSSQFSCVPVTLPLTPDRSPRKSVIGATISRAGEWWCIVRAYDWGTDCSCNGVEERGCDVGMRGMRKDCSRTRTVD